MRLFVIFTLVAAFISGCASFKSKPGGETACSKQYVFEAVKNQMYYCNNDNNNNDCYGYNATLKWFKTNCNDYDDIIASLRGDIAKVDLQKMHEDIKVDSERKKAEKEKSRIESESIARCREDIEKLPSDSNIVNKSGLDLPILFNQINKNISYKTCFGGINAKNISYDVSIRYNDRLKLYIAESGHKEYIKSGYRGEYNYTDLQGRKPTIYIESITTPYFKLKDLLPFYSDNDNNIAIDFHDKNITVYNKTKKFVKILSIWLYGGSDINKNIVSEFELPPEGYNKDITALLTGDYAQDKRYTDVTSQLAKDTIFTYGIAVKYQIAGGVENTLYNMKKFTLFDLINNNITFYSK